jgi:3-phytase
VALLGARLLAAATGLGLGASLPVALESPTTAHPEARVETAPVPHDGDAADDPAVWIHPETPESSLIIGTDKQGALHTYNMNGSERQRVAQGTLPNNVDVIYGFTLAGRTVDLAVASARASTGRGVRAWAIDPATRMLSDATGGSSLTVLGGGEPYGICGYRSARTGRLYYVVTDKDGRVEQYEVQDAGGGRIGGTKVRSLKLGSVAEGCVADDELGFLYVAEEAVGIWKFGAEPDAGTTRTIVARVGADGLTADVEGLTIYYAAGGAGYLIASSQGNNTFKVYERRGENPYLLTIDPKAGRIDDVNDTDGVDVTGCPTSPQFTKGVFVVQDGSNSGGNQNFKLYAWEDIAGTNLLIDTGCHIPRTPQPPR